MQRTLGILTLALCSCLKITDICASAVFTEEEGEKEDEEGDEDEEEGTADEEEGDATAEEGDADPGEGTSSGNKGEEVRGSS